MSDPLRLLSLVGNPPGHLFGVRWPRRVRHLHRLGGCAHFQRSRLQQSTPASKRPLAASLVPVCIYRHCLDGCIRLSLLYTTYRSCKKHCCSSCCQETPGNNLTRDLAAENPDEREKDCKKSKDKERVMMRLTIHANAAITVAAMWPRGTRPWVQSRSGFKTSQCPRLLFSMPSHARCLIPGM